MKKLIFIATMISISVPAYAAPSCLTKEETKELFMLRMNLQQIQIKKPECKNTWGNMGCMPSMDLARISYFEAKENGDLDACHVKEEVETSDIEKSPN